MISGGKRLGRVQQRKERHMEPDGITRLCVFLYRIIAVFFIAAAVFILVAALIATVAGHLHSGLCRQFFGCAVQGANKYPRIEEQEECKDTVCRCAFHGEQI